MKHLFNLGNEPLVPEARITRKVIAKYSLALKFLVLIVVV